MISRHEKNGIPSASYPFSALVGQKTMLRALLLAAVDPSLGGVLLKGEKGTAKSTAARGLAQILRLAFRDDTPFVDLPLGATEDRLVGSLDLEAAVKDGRLKLSPGLLARADQGVLYVDEINLLPAHLGQLLLDAAAGGQVRVEREGLSLTQPARFTLLASYNPEEGPLSPQLLDRFGLVATVAAEKSPAARKELILRRLAFEADPAGFARQWRPRQQELANRLLLARRGLGQVTVSRKMRLLAGQMATELFCQGQRGELCLVKAARALAAWRGLSRVEPTLLAELAPLALSHRAGSAAPAAARVRVLGRLDPQDEKAGPQTRLEKETAQAASEQSQAEGGESVLRVLAPAAVKPIATRAPAREGGSLRQAGRRAAREVAGNRGRYLRASAQRLGRSLAFDATFRAAAPHQKERRAPGGPALVVKAPDIREKVRAARRGRLLLFCVDASGSMNAAARMAETKAAVLGILTEAYQKRDRVGLIAFGGSTARELLPPTPSVEVARRLLAEMPTGGKTPLAAGMSLTATVLARELAADPKLTPLVVLMTDGRPNVPLAASLGEEVDLEVAGNKGGGWGDGWGDGGYADREVLNLAQRLAGDGRARYVVVDTDTHHHHEINLCPPLADYLGAPLVPLSRLSAGQVLDLVKANW